MSRHLYLMAWHPGMTLTGENSKGLHAGGLRYLIDEVEQLGTLERDSAIQARKEGLFVVTPKGAEQISDLATHFSDQLLQRGITDNWLDENFCFGNSTSCLRVSADYSMKEVNHECGRTKAQMMLEDGFLDYFTLKTHMVHDFTEAWGAYERRWRAGTCPQQNHQMLMTTMLFKHELSASSYQRILDIVENAAIPRYPEVYESDEPGKYLSTFRRYDGKPVFRVKEALPEFFNGVI